MREGIRLDINYILLKMAPVSPSFDLTMQVRSESDRSSNSAIRHNLKSFCFRMNFSQSADQSMSVNQ